MKAPKRKPGRPTKLTKAGTLICDLIRKGVPRERAARLAGVNEATFHRWMAAGLEESPSRGRHREFRKGVLRAEDDLISRATAAVVDAFETRACTTCDTSGEVEGRPCPRCLGRREVYVHELRDRTAAARFMLPHRFPGEFSTRAEVRHQGPDGGPVKVQAEVAVRPLLTDEQLASLDADGLAAVIRGLVPDDRTGGEG